MVLETVIAAFIQWGTANPDAVARGVAAVNSANAVNTNRFGAFADMSQQILRCYHPTARFQSAELLETPWQRQSQYNATASSLISIEYVGLSNVKYVMQVGLVRREGAVKTTVIADSAKIRASARCKLEDWISLDPAAAPK